MNFASDFVLAKRCMSKPSLDPEQEDDAEPDTNIVSLKFNQLAEVCQPHTGNPIECSNCEGILSKFSAVSQVNPISGKRTWICNFCQFENSIFLALEEVPSQQEVTYMIEPAKSAAQPQETSNEYLIFCIDISGSMAVTTKVIKSCSKLFKSIFKMLICIQKVNSSKYISRLDAVKHAIEANLINLEKNSPEKKVGLVTFSHSVNIIGDGEKRWEQKISGPALDTKEEIESRALETPTFDSIKSSQSRLAKRLSDLEEIGATALGPALFFSVCMASKQPGSQVILCTDGLANTGLGSLDVEDIGESTRFYTDIGDMALANGVSVSLITIEGTDCRLGLLGDIADKTMGAVSIVNPLYLSAEFSAILKDEIIATSVSVKLILPKVLYVRDDEAWNTRQSRVLKQIGNVTRETEMTLEFGVREDGDFDDNVSELPFQLQITYIAKDGSRMLRVLTVLRNVTQSREVAEKNSDRTILTSHLAQSSSRQVQRNRVNKKTEKMASYIRQM